MVAKLFHSKISPHLAAALALISSTWLDCAASKVFANSTSSYSITRSAWEKGCTYDNICATFVSQIKADGVISAHLGVALTRGGDYYFFFLPSCDVPAPSRVRVNDMYTLELRLQPSYPCTMLFAKLSNVQRDGIIFGSFLTYSTVDTSGLTREFKVDLTDFPRNMLGTREDWHPAGKHWDIVLRSLDKALNE